MHLLIYKKIKKCGFSDKQIKKIIDYALRSVYKKSADCEISIHLVGEQSIKKLNYKYRGINKITDVISFATQDVFWGKDTDKDLGDLFICPKKIEKQAKEFFVSYEEEFVRILIHGVLHLCGFDHQTDKEKKEMFALQEKVLQKLL